MSSALPSAPTLDDPQPTEPIPSAPDDYEPFGFPLPDFSGNPVVASGGAPSVPSDATVESGSPMLVIEPAYVDTPDSNPVIILGAISALVQSIIANGQVIPGIVCKHPTKPGYWLCLDGNKRLVAVRVAGIKFKAIELIGEITPAKLARLRIIANRSGKRMSDEQLADELDIIIAEEKCTQEAAAQECGVSASEACKARKFKAKAITAVKEALAAKQIVRDTARAISSVPHEKQNAFLERAIREEMKSDVAEKVAKELRGKGVPKIKTWTAKVGKHAATIKGDLLEGAEALINRLQEVVKRLKRGDSTDPLNGLIQ